MLGWKGIGLKYSERVREGEEERAKHDIGSIEFDVMEALLWGKKQEEKEEDHEEEEQSGALRNVRIAVKC
ncbi:hypothetical protein E2C01_091762 [Portunus trituberculatus]|uniref:Uncharacterized protein n=1 Tax=Portunus trituberculatus TaxID=210409 RepID=A0A5B7JID9_PORTR|nr:hypothetical protein [Portunus trituberculatus]